MDITGIARKLLNELKEEAVLNRGIQEGIVLLHDKIDAALKEEKAEAEKRIAAAQAALAEYTEHEKQAGSNERTNPEK